LFEQDVRLRLNALQRCWGSRAESGDLVNYCLLWPVSSRVLAGCFEFCLQSSDGECRVLLSLYTFFSFDKGPCRLLVEAKMHEELS
jgi:hypothetical protein